MQNPRQMKLFKPTIGGVVAEVKDAMNQAVRDSGYSREQVVDLVNGLAVRHRVKLVSKGGLTKDTLDKWLNVEDESRVPSIKGLVFFCGVLETVKPIEAMIQFLGGQIIHDDDIPLLDWAKLYQKTKAHKAKMRKLEAEL